MGESNKANYAWSVQIEEENHHMIGGIPDMLKKTLGEMKNSSNISREKGRWKRKEKLSSIFERLSVNEEFTSSSIIYPWEAFYSSCKLLAEYESTAMWRC